MRFPVLPEVQICRYQPSRHSLGYFFTLLGTDRFGAHGRIFVVLVVEHQHRNHASAVVVIGQQLGPTIVPQSGPPDEPASPVIAVLLAILVSKQKGQIHFALRKRSGYIVPVAHQEAQDFICFGKSAERMHLRRIVAK